MYFGTVVKNLGFTNIYANEIDWQNSQVFSHIMHPLTRRTKGIAEFFNLIDGLPPELILSTIDKWPSILQILQTPFFEEHSVPLTVLYGDRINDIHFIPIDDPTIDYVQVTKEYLRSYNLDPVFPEEKINVAEDTQVRLVDIIDEHYSQNRPALIDAVFAEDIKLYQQVVQSYKQL
jgi:hypothetical protein